jgi:hypothetical protein
VRHPAGYLTNPAGQVVTIKGRPVEVGPIHIWRCACDCHTSAEPPLFDPTSKWQRHLVAAPTQLALFGRPT